MDKKRFLVTAYLLEISLLALGAYLFCRKILVFDPLTVLGGGEYILLIQTHFIWELFQECGACVLWNGLMNGGAPTFAEIHNAPAHPFVAIPAIFLGAVDGSKITLLLSLFTAGYAQWRLSKTMGLSVIPRLWSGFMMMYGGHLSGKMEYGNVGLILSAACSFLVISELYQFAFREYPRKYLIRLAVFLSLCLLSGQGYFQLVIFLLIIPLTVLFTYLKIGKPAVLKMAQAVGLMILLCGFFLLPLLMFFPNIVKEFDPFLNSLQPIGYSILNLVIKDRSFFSTEVLEKQGFAFAYYVYIGWIPVLLAVYGAYRGYRAQEHRQETLWFLLSFFLIYAITCREILLPLSEHLDFLTRLRYASIMTVLVIMPLLSLAAVGLNHLLEKPFNYFYWQLKEDNKLIQIPIIHIFLIVTLLFSLSDVAKSSHEFLYTVDLGQPDPGFKQYFISEAVQWVEPMNTAFFPYLFMNHGKITNVVRGWWIKDRPKPTAAVLAVHHPDAPDPEASVSVGEVDYYINSETSYAAILQGQSIQSNCNADTSGGGEIHISCPNPSNSAGTLIVQENYFSGWKAWMDGKRVKLDKHALFLTVNHLPPGSHDFVFKYQPWDIWLGLMMTLLGILYSLKIGGVFDKVLINQS
jgi:hypothetical protein